MKKKNSLLSCLTFLFLPLIISAQDTIDYFGQDPPGDIAQEFAPDLYSASGIMMNNPMFSPDGKEFYFTTSDADWNTMLMVSKYSNKTWTKPVNSNIPTTSVVWGNCFSPDGNIIYFNSNNSWTLDIWYRKRTESGWSDAEKLSETINSIGSEIAYSISADSTLYFRSTGPDGSEDIFLSEIDNGIYNSYSHLDLPINTSYNEYYPIISPDEDYLIFHTNRQGPQVTFISFKKQDGSWTNPKEMGRGIDIGRGGSLTPDGKYLLFSNGEIYWIALENIIDSLRRSNFIPYVKNNIPDTSIIVNSNFTYTIPDSVFYDDDGNETLTITLETELPGWLDYYESTMTFSGTPVAEESLDIEISATDTAGAGVSDIFQILVEGPSGIDNYSEPMEELSLYPNPANKIVHIQYSKLAVNSIYQLLDLRGTVVKQGIVENNTIDLSGIYTGMYMLIIENNGKKILGRIIADF